MCDACATDSSAVTISYAVTGMSCDHCKAAVTAEVEKIDGVNSVDVDVAAGTVTVESSTELDDATIRAAVDEAGYELTGRR